MKTISRYIMTLALLITAVGGAWATETVETTLWEGTYTDDGVEINSTTVSEFNAGDVLRVYVTVPMSGSNFKIVYKGASNDWTETAIPSVGSDWPWLNDGGDTYMDVTFTEADITALTGMSIYICKGEESTITKVTLITPAAAEPAIDVTTNAVEEGATFTQASFQMPAYDATVNYMLVRDMGVQMTATMGNGTDGVRYRVKKNEQVPGKYEPAEMDMMQVLGLVAVNDGIEQKALTLDKDYFCRIYKLDEQTLLPLSADGVNLADFDFAPGLYALKAFAKDDSDYAGETDLSNTFKLFQGYEVTVAAKEFITYYKDEPLYVEDEAAELYTISSVNGDQAVLSEKSDAMPSNTPMLVYNKSNETKTFLLIPCAEPDLAITVAPEFQGTLTATTIAASTDAQTNYALNGKQFVFVKDAIEIGPNKAWLSIPSGILNARALTIVFSDATGINGVSGVNGVNDGSWYDLNGRKLNGMPTKKGVYIMNGKKVVVR